MHREDGRRCVHSAGVGLPTRCTENKERQIIQGRVVRDIKNPGGGGMESRGDPKDFKILKSRLSDQLEISPAQGALLSGNLSEAHLELIVMRPMKKLLGGLWS